MASNTEAPKELKKLAFVVTYASFLVRFSQRGYTGIRAFVPTAAISSLVKVEEFAAERSAPFVLRAMDAGGAALTFADEKVNQSLGFMTGKYTNTVAEGVSAVSSFKESSIAKLETEKARYYAMAAATSASISQALAPYTAMLQQLHTSMTEVTQQVLNPKVSIRTFCLKRWVAFSSSATGAKTIVWTQALGMFGLESICSVNKIVVVSPYYKATVDKGTSTLCAVQASSLYGFTKRYPYPLFASILDPVYTSLVTNPHLTQAVSFWTPRSAAVVA